MEEIFYLIIAVIASFFAIVSKCNAPKALWTIAAICYWLFVFVEIFVKLHSA